MILVNAAEMQEMDRRTIDSFGLPGRVLMENAGRGAARFLSEQFPDLMNKRIGVIAGRGNNGGDGFVIARYLAQSDIPVHVYLLSVYDTVKGDAAVNLKLLDPLKVPVTEIPDEASLRTHQSEMENLDIWIDAILGTGLRSDVKGYFRDVINFINSLNKPIFAVDIPSGLNSDTGQPCGACIRAEATATFAFAKTGHMVYPGVDFTGRLKIVDIGIPPYIAQKAAPRHFMLTADLIGSYLKNRLPDAHKGTTGHLLVIAGSTGKTGAASMTSISALRAGAGLVTLGIAESLNAVLESQMLEAMTTPLPESQTGILGDSAFETIEKLMSGKKCLAIGPGLGQADETKRLIRKIIQTSDIPVVVDADGLNNLVGQVQILQGAKAPIILTPHPGEMARLLDTKASVVQQDRINCAREFAVKYKVHVVLKGARTVIAHPDGRIFINPTGNAGMATGGMGDVLTGIIAGCIVQGLSPEPATHVGTYLHGAAADFLAETIGPFGYLAGDVMKGVPGQIKKILSGQ